MDIVVGRVSGNHESEGRDILIKERLGPSMPDNSVLFKALAAGLSLDAVECADAVQRLSGDRRRSRLR